MSKWGKASSLAGAFVVAAMIAAPGAGWSQTSSTPPPPPPPPSNSTSTEVSQVVVTGTLIKHTAYNTPAPINVITSDQMQLTGSADVAQTLQQSAVAGNNYQINNTWTGFITTGGPGVNTLSLRGLGAQRTLILIDGERMGPAGVGGTVGPIDLNTIPNSIIDHVEILTDGASSIYGSDAVAGVVNIITKKNLDGGELEIYGNPSQQGGGDEYHVDGAWGKTFDRGYFNAGFDIYQQEALRNGQRPYLSCARDLSVDATTGQNADIIDPATGQPKCWNMEGPDVIDYGSPAGITFYRSAPGTVGGSGPTGLNLPGFEAVGLTLATPAETRASYGLFPYSPNQYEEGTALSPVTRYTLTAAGGLELTPHNQLYGTLLLNQRDSLQDTPAQFFTFVNPSNPGNTAGFGFPLPVIPYLWQTTQRVDYERAVLGVKGDVPAFAGLSGWTYDVFGQVSASQGSYTSNFALSDRVNAVAGAGGALSCDPNAYAPYGSGNTLAQQEPGVACVPVNLFQDVVNGALSPADAAFLFKNETGTTTYNQYYLQGQTSGKLITLPAGPVQAAIGFQVRREELDDTPPPDVVNGNAYNITTAGVTKGSEEAEEAYGELDIPVIKDFPLIDSFDADISGRLSHYSNYGTNGTFKLGLVWKVTDWFEVRATDGTAFRAPELYEQYLADQTSFLGQTSIDPCTNWGTSGVSANVQKNCMAQGLPSNFQPQAPSAEIFTGGGRSLKPETSLDQTIGVVFTPKWFNLNLKIAATYFAYDITNQIQQFGAANIIYQCYNSPNLSSPFCSLFSPRGTVVGSPYYQSFATVNDDFVNVAQQIDQGLDLEVTYIRQLPMDTKLTVEGNIQWTFYTNTILLGGQTNNYLGQVSQPAFDGNINFRLDHGDWTLNYYLNMVGHVSDNDFVSDTVSNWYQTGETVFLNHVVPFYSTSDIALQRRFDKFKITLGVKNLFDTPPPYYSADGFQDRQGVVPFPAEYDLVGRTFFIDVVKKF